MPIPKTKEELIHMSEENFTSLLTMISSYSEKQQHAEFKPGPMNRNIRDVLAHLHHWHLLFIEWYMVGMNGEKPYIPAKGFTWKTLPELNTMIWKHYQHHELYEILTLIEKSHQKVLSFVNRHSESELFTMKKYAWTGSTSLAVYLRGALSSHYDWAIKLIKKSLQSE